MIAVCKRLASHALFHDAIIGVIVLNAVILGLETSSQAMQAAGGWLLALNHVIQAVFVFEVAVQTSVTGSYRPPVLR